MFGFWIAAAFLAASAAALILARAARAVGADVGQDPTIGVYQRALTEIDDLADRGLIPSDERRAARAEAGRRLLGAAEAGATAPRRGLGPILTIAIAAAAPIAALILYLTMGSPGTPDQPFARRLAEWKAHPERDQAPELAAALRAKAAEHPRDPEPLAMLARFDLSLGDPDAAIHALRKALTIAPGRADLLAPLGEILVLKAGGDVGADAQTIFRQALQSDPASPTARYYLAKAQIAGGNTAGGLAAWRALASDLPASDPRRAMLADEIAAVEKTGRLPPNAPATTPDQSAQISGAIRGMVDGLAARLQTHPDDPAGWVRLVRAYGVLGEADKQARALSDARRRYAGRPDILSALAAAQKPSRPVP